MPVNERKHRLRNSVAGLILPLKISKYKELIYSAFAVIALVMFLVSHFLQGDGDGQFIIWFWLLEVAIFLPVYCYIANEKGSIHVLRISPPNISKAKNPLGFWLAVLFYMAVAIAFLWGAIANGI